MIVNRTKGIVHIMIFICESAAGNECSKQVRIGMFRKVTIYNGTQIFCITVFRSPVVF